MLLKQARYFVTVADAGSFTEAAERLFLSVRHYPRYLQQVEMEDLNALTCVNNAYKQMEERK